MASRIADRYALGPSLGSGGMGTVHLALDERLDREVAIKLVPVAGTSLALRRRFVREARATARIHHPNAVAVFDAGDAGGYLYLVMARIQGQSLAEELAASGRFALDDAVAVVGDVLAALDAAHTAGVVHRDIKPGNVMRAHDGTITVVDFGIARVLDEPDGEITAAGEFVGTPRYVAPEQLAGLPATAATDVYAVGVLLHELLTGEVPFDRGSPLATALAHRDDPVPDPRTRRPEIPVHVATVVQRALAKSPDARFDSAAAMRAALVDPAAAVVGAATRMMPAADRPTPSNVPPTMVLPVGATSATRHRRPWLAVAAAAIAIAGVAIAITRSSGDDETAASGSTAPAAPGATGGSTTTTPPTPTTANADHRDADDRGARGGGVAPRAPGQPRRADPHPRRRPGAIRGADERGDRAAR